MWYKHNCLRQLCFIKNLNHNSLWQSLPKAMMASPQLSTKRIAWCEPLANLLMQKCSTKCSSRRCSPWIFAAFSFWQDNCASILQSKIYAPWVCLFFFIKNTKSQKKLIASCFLLLCKNAFLHCFNILHSKM